MGPQLDKERREEKRLEALNMDNSSDEFCYKGRKEMRLQLKEEYKVKDFFFT